MELKIPPVVQALIFGILIWAADRWVPLGRLEGSWLTGVAILFLIGGFALGFLGIATFQKAQTTIRPENPERASRIVGHGVYKMTRNPMYLGSACILIAWSLFIGSWVGLIFVALFMLYITRFQIMPEERILTQKFGDEYKVYQAKVRRWL